MLDSVLPKCHMRNVQTGEKERPQPHFGSGTHWGSLTCLIWGLTWARSVCSQNTEGWCSFYWTKTRAVEKREKAVTTGTGGIKTAFEMCGASLQSMQSMEEAWGWWGFLAECRLTDRCWLTYVRHYAYTGQSSYQSSEDSLSGIELPGSRLTHALLILEVSDGEVDGERHQRRAWHYSGHRRKTLWAAASSVNVGIVQH